MGGEGFVRASYCYSVEHIKTALGRIAEFLEEIKNEALNYGFDIVLNEESNLGISHSINLGINLDKDADGYMFMVCDQPFISEDSIIKLMEVFSESEKGICSTAYMNKLGNPNIFSRKYINELCSLQGDIGGKYVLKNHLDDLEILNVDEVELIDIDTREELNSIFNIK